MINKKLHEELEPFVITVLNSCILPEQFETCMQWIRRLYMAGRIEIRKALKAKMRELKIEGWEEL